MGILFPDILLKDFCAEDDEATDNPGMDLGVASRMDDSVTLGLTTMESWDESPKLLLDSIDARVAGKLKGWQEYAAILSIKPAISSCHARMAGVSPISGATVTLNYQYLHASHFAFYWGRTPQTEAQLHIVFQPSAAKVQHSDQDHERKKKSPRIIPAIRLPPIY
ncbi:hypothetical protein VTO42DRAFT_506 [Malbranchea cinnamomea]